MRVCAYYCAACGVKVGPEVVVFGDAVDPKPYCHSCVVDYEIDVLERSPHEIDPAFQSSASRLSPVRSTVEVPLGQRRRLRRHRPRARAVAAAGSSGEAERPIEIQPVVPGWLAASLGAVGALLIAVLTFVWVGAEARQEPPLGQKPRTTAAPRGVDGPSGLELRPPEGGGAPGPALSHGRQVVTDRAGHGAPVEIVREAGEDMPRRGGGEAEPGTEPALDPGAVPDPEPEAGLTEAEEPDAAQDETVLIGTRTTQKVHTLDCTFGERVLFRNKVLLGSLEEAIAQGFEPCKSCLGDQVETP